MNERRASELSSANEAIGARWMPSERARERRELFGWIWVDEFTAIVVVREDVVCNEAAKASNRPS